MEDVRTLEFRQQSPNDALLWLSQLVFGKRDSPGDRCLQRLTGMKNEGQAWQRWNFGAEVERTTVEWADADHGMGTG